VTRLIVFLSDYGLEDEFAGVCRGVMAQIAPDARIVDLTHAVPRHDVTQGALTLARSAPFMPPDAVFLAVVDPGVGSARRPVALEASKGAFLVGPDNGLLMPAAAALGGVARAVHITSPKVVLPSVSSTFHGRDLFAPAAAHLAAEAGLEELGPSIDPGTLEDVTVPVPEIGRGTVECSVLSIDGFGNVQLNVQESDLMQAGLSGESELSVRTPREERTVSRVHTFSDAPEGEVVALLDSSGYLALVANRGHAAELLSLEPGDTVIVARVG